MWWMECLCSWRSIWIEVAVFYELVFSIRLWCTKWHWLLVYRWWLFTLSMESRLFRMPYVSFLPAHEFRWFTFCHFTSGCCLTLCLLLRLYVIYLLSLLLQWDFMLFFQLLLLILQSHLFSHIKFSFSLFFSFLSSFFLCHLCLKSFLLSLYLRLFRINLLVWFELRDFLYLCLRSRNYLLIAGARTNHIV